MNAAVPATPAVGARLIAIGFLPFAAGYFVSYLYRTVNAVIGPNLAAEVGLSAADLGALTSAYFAAFAAIQIPLGMLLDRFGPRRVESALLLIAAAGALVFAAAQSVAMLVIGRALIGLGVAACLMAGFKANVQFWPRERLLLINGCLLACGGAGAAAATLPVEWLLGFIDWRGVFVLLAACTLVVAAYIFFVVPERSQATEDGWAAQLDGMTRVFRSAAFWRVAPLMMTTQAAFLAYQGLWAGPWLRDIGQLERADVALALFFISASLAPGFFFGGAIADRLTRSGIRATTVIGALVAGFLAIQAAILVDFVPNHTLAWTAFALVGTGNSLFFGALTQSFPAALAGRVNTALNLCIFVAAFAAQAGIGAIVNLYPATAAGFAPAGHRAALLVVLAIELAAFVWFVLPRRA
ncbi:MAG: MFS transporter [Proteobacteria bacterium]|nr:MFS transporter [Pseudomonadota bacterium]